MLNRVLEPEVMDSPREAIDYDAMDHAQVNERFVEDLLAFAAPVEPAPEEDDEPAWLDVLDMGTGTAQIPIKLCERTAHVRVMAIDMAVNMLDLARANVEIAGLPFRVTLDRQDAKALPYDSGRFDWVVSNSLAHHIPEPAQALAEAVRVVKPGGVLFFRDLARPSDAAEVARMVAQYAGQENERQQEMFANSLRAALTLDEIRALVRALGADPESVTMTSDRHWTWAFRKAP